MKSKPGRPRVDRNDRTVQVCVSLPARQYDEIDQRARREGVSLPERIRRDLQRQPSSR
jgi:hypothetical protein